MGWSKLIALLTVAVVFSLGVYPQSEKPISETESNDGLIDGTVFYDDGKPVKGATAYADPLGVDIGAVIPHADTDEAGRFIIHIPRSWFGKFAVTAGKESEDYPTRMHQFYSNGKFETVILSSDHPFASVNIRIGPKAGVLEGKVTDAATGAPLRPCVEFRRAANPNNFMRGSGIVDQSYKLFVPPDTDVLMKIWLDGYRPWYFPGTYRKAQRKGVRLRPGEHLSLDIPLMPDAKYVQSGCPAPLDTGSL
jgi:hypothetical protein